MNLFSQPIDALNSVNACLSATLRVSSWIVGPETGIILEPAVLNQDHTVTSGSLLLIRVHIRLGLDAVFYSSLRLIVFLN